MTDPIDAALARARQAQREVEFWPQERIDAAVLSAGWQVYNEDTAARLTTLAYSETQLGDPEHLLSLHRRRVLGTLRDLHDVRTCDLIEIDEIRGLSRYAKPVGVIAVACPATAPSSGIAVNALPMLKTRNAAIFSPNPRAQGASEATVDVLREALAAAGAPEDLVQCVRAGGRDGTQRLMAGADLVVAAGGAGTVRRAYHSGTAAISAGVGNPAVIVDETADLESAARLILTGAGYNNGTSCSSESNVLVEARVAPRFRELLGSLGGKVCDPVETARLREVLWPADGSLDRSVIGRSASVLAAAAGIRLEHPDRTTVLVCQAPMPARRPHDRLLGEKLAPVVVVMEYTSFEDAVSTVSDLLDECGSGHSCGIHTRRPERIAELAARARSCRVMVNQSTAIGNSGSFTNGLPFTSTISSGTWGGCSRSENVTWRDFVNLTQVSTPLPEDVPDEALIFAGLAAPVGLRSSGKEPSA